MVFQPFSLLDLSADIIKTSNLKYDYNNLPRHLVDYLNYHVKITLDKSNKIN